MRKYLCVIEIKPECRDEYIGIHNNPWREMLEAIRDAGYTNEALFYYKDQSIIYLECPDDTTHACAQRISARNGMSRSARGLRRSPSCAKRFSI